MNQEKAEQVAGGNRWRVSVELTWDVKPEDCEFLASGDTVQDFAGRALQRMRPDLDNIVGKGKPFAHYQILESTKACVELD